MNEPMVKIGGVHEKISQKGNKYFIGRLNGARLLMFVNTDKKQPNEPDWFLYVQERTDAPKPQTVPGQDRIPDPSDDEPMRKRWPYPPGREF